MRNRAVCWKESRRPIDAHPIHESSFAAKLSPSERRLAGRLESFGDIVFGFAVSQCALQLPTVRGHVDIEHPLALVLYFVTFGLTATLWLMYHRMMASTFRASGVDLVLAFSYLALASLIPYAMYAITHEFELRSAQIAVGEYTALYGTMTAISSVITLRNFRRGYHDMSDDDRLHAWRSFLRHVVLFVMMTIASIIDYTVGPATAGFFLFLIAPAIPIVRRLFARVPSPGRLGIRARASLANPPVP